MTHWAIALYDRYVQLYGEPIEQPIRSNEVPPTMNDGTIPSTSSLRGGDECKTSPPPS